MTVLVITGTSTDVGKTVVTAALAALALGDGQSVAVCKPAQTGVAAGSVGDLAEITRLCGVSEVVELARYPDPLAPETAAARASMPLLTLSAVVDAVRERDRSHDLVLVEGAGGVLVRLGVNGFTVLDVARELCAPILVVTAAGLGTLNHTELTVRAVTSAGVDCVGVVIGAWPTEPGLAEQCNLADLPRVTGVPLLGRIPAGAGLLDHDGFTRAAPSWIRLPRRVTAGTGQ